MALGSHTCIKVFSRPRWWRACARLVFQQGTSAGGGRRHDDQQDGNEPATAVRNVRGGLVPSDPRRRCVGSLAGRQYRRTVGSSRKPPLLRSERAVEAGTVSFDELQSSRREGGNSFGTVVGTLNLEPRFRVHGSGLGVRTGSGFLVLGSYQIELRGWAKRATRYPEPCTMNLEPFSGGIRW